jgi:hypothetical protein
MASAVRFVLNPLGVRELVKSPALASHVSHVTDSLRDTARAGSPVVTGHFAESFTVDHELTAQGAVGTLGNSDPGATAIEFGSIHNRPFAPMRRAVRALGLRLKEDK